jgi:hypothetical protein
VGYCRRFGDVTRQSFSALLVGVEAVGEPERITVSTRLWGQRSAEADDPRGRFRRTFGREDRCSSHLYRRVSVSVLGSGVFPVPGVPDGNSLTVLARWADGTSMQTTMSVVGPAGAEASFVLGGSFRPFRRVGVVVGFLRWRRVCGRAGGWVCVGRVGFGGGGGTVCLRR